MEVVEIKSELPARPTPRQLSAETARIRALSGSPHALPPGNWYLRFQSVQQELDTAFRGI